MTARRSRGAREPSNPNSNTETDPGGGSDTTPGLAFEDGLERLEVLVAQLEDGELQLEAALGAFEEGVKLSRQLDRQLGEAEQRVELLLQEGGRWVTEPLDTEDREEEA